MNPAVASTPHVRSLADTPLWAVWAPHSGRDGLADSTTCENAETAGVRLVVAPQPFLRISYSGQQGVLPWGQLDRQAVDDDRRAAVLVEARAGSGSCRPRRRRRSPPWPSRAGDRRPRGPGAGCGPTAAARCRVAPAAIGVPSSATVTVAGAPEVLMTCRARWPSSVLVVVAKTPGHCVSSRSPGVTPRLDRARSKSTGSDGTWAASTMARPSPSGTSTPHTAP